MSSVMIIDDQSTSRLILEELVSSVAPDLETHSFGSPLAALEWAQSNKPDLVLTDFKMPEMNGVELILELRKLPSCADVPIIVITIVDDRAVRYQALEAGATDILNKPVDHHECRARCRNLLTLRKQAQIIKNRARWLEKQVAEATRGLRARERESLLLLATTVERREDPGGERARRVGHLAGLIAQRLGIGEDQAEIIEYAAMLHDIGKVFIPERILLKPARLTAEEFDEVKTHTTLGAELLRDNSSPVLVLGAEIALSHHERFDGLGYPRGLKGEDIPLPARIVAVADVYDALTSTRPYRGPVSMEKAIETLNQQRGAAFDPRCLEAFSGQLDRVAAYDKGHRFLQDVD
jgi:two-component system response regulator RpfG